MNRTDVKCVHVLQLLAIVLAILAVFGGVWYMAGKLPLDASKCLNNMRQIESAKYSFSMANSLTNGTVLTPAQCGRVISVAVIIHS